MGKVSLHLKDVLALFLAIVFVFQLIPVSVLAYAQDLNSGQGDSEIQIPPLSGMAAAECENVGIVSEDVSRRDAYTKVYLLEDGTYYSLTSAIPIHTQVEGVWTDIVVQSAELPANTDAAQALFDAQVNATAAMQNTSTSTRMMAAPKSGVEENSADVTVSVVGFGTYTDESTGEIVANTDRIGGTNALWVHSNIPSGWYGEQDTATVYAQLSVIFTCHTAGVVMAQEVESDWGTPGLSISPNSSSQIAVSDSMLDYVSIATTDLHADWIITDLMCSSGSAGWPKITVFCSAHLIIARSLSTEKKYESSACYLFCSPLSCNRQA